MKIAVTSTGPTLDDNVEARFGRCAYFLVVEPETMDYEAIDNPNIALGGGAGIQSAQLMSEKGVTTVLTGNCGPNAFNVFGQAGIQVIVGISGAVRKAVEQFKTGAFPSASRPSVASHFGIGTALADPTPTGHAMTGPVGQGGGMGFGMGGGRGMGKGMGRGRGMGKGMGRGMGRGGGMGMGMAASLVMPGAGPALNRPTDFLQNAPTDAKDQELAALKQQAQQLERQQQQIEQSITELETARNLVAVVLAEKCAGCGICADVCPVSAIEVKGQAVVQADLCTGCALCVGECPNNAIVLTQQKRR